MCTFAPSKSENKVMAATFVHKKALEKQDARLFVLKHYKGGNVLSLSADNFFFEKMLLDKINNNQVIDCYEYKKKDYLLGKKEFAVVKKMNKNCNHIYDNIFNADFTKYDFIFLDLCCNLSNETVTNIISSLQNFKGAIFITLQRQREKFKPEDLDFYGVPQGTKEERKAFFRDKTFIELVKQYTGLKEIAKRYDYRNTKQVRGKTKYGSPMGIYSFKRK